LPFKQFGVIDVMTAQSVAPRRTIMKTFTIDTDNNITAFPTPDHAEAAVGSGSQAFTNQKQLADLAAAWPTERLVEIWNSLPGVEPVKGFKSAKAAASRIWGRIQTLGESPEPKAPTKAKAAKQARPVAPSKAKSAKKTTPAKKATKAPQKPEPNPVRRSVVGLVFRNAWALRGGLEPAGTNLRLTVLDSEGGTPKVPPNSGEIRFLRG
jgi:hypothetical protein